MRLLVLEKPYKYTVTHGTDGSEEEEEKEVDEELNKIRPWPRVLELPLLHQVS